MQRSGERVACRVEALESQGLIEIKRGRGGGGVITMPKLDNLSESLALILQLQQTTLGDLDEARLMFEPLLAGRLAARHTDEDLEVLHALADQAQQAANDDNKQGLASRQRTSTKQSSNAEAITPWRSLAYCCMTLLIANFEAVRP